MKKLFILFLVVLAFSACSKGTFETKPTVDIDSFGPEEVERPGAYFQLKATVTDKEGDLQDTVIVVRKRYNGTTLLSTDSSQRFNLKAFGSPVKSKIELLITFVYGRLEDFAITQELERNADRNLRVGLIVKDNAGNRSDYVESEPIVLKRFQ